MNLQIVLCAVIIGLFYVPVEANKTKNLAQQIANSCREHKKSNNTGSTTLFKGVAKLTNCDKDARPCRTQKKAGFRSAIDE